MPDTFELRDAAPTDVEAIARLHRTVFEATYPTFPRLHSPHEDIQHFGEVLENRVVVLATSGDTIIGYCAYGEGWLDDLYVYPEYHARGVGSALLVRAKERHLYLQLWTFQENTRASAFYEGRGFQVAELTDGAGNEMNQPDVRYSWSSGDH